jgi:lipoprotein-releasing system permease protein
VNFPYYIAQRYLKSKSRHNAINIITKIASVGIIVGAMALFVVLSVFSGLREFSLSFTNDFDPDYKILPKTGKSFLVTTPQLNALKKIDDSNYSQVVEERVLFTFNKKQQVTYLKGVDQNFIKINKISSNLFNGQWLKPNTYQVVMGYGISQKLSVGVFDFNNPLEVTIFVKILGM